MGELLFTARYSFTRPCIIFNVGYPKDELKCSIVDFYFETLEEAKAHHIIYDTPLERCKDSGVKPFMILRMKSIKRYDKIISKKIKCSHLGINDYSVRISKETIAVD